MKLTTDAVRYYLNAIKTSFEAKALGSEDAAKEYAEVHSKLAKRFWSNIPEAERKARTKAALEARWKDPKNKK